MLCVKEAGPSGAIPRNGSSGTEEEELNGTHNNNNAAEMRMIRVPIPSFIFCQTQN